MRPIRTKSAYKTGKRLAVLLFAAALLIQFALPSFASNESDAPELDGSDMTEQSEEIRAEEDGADDAVKEDDESSENEKGGDVSETEKTGQEQKQSEGHEELRSEGGEMISYTGERVGTDIGITTVFTVSSGGTEYTGACAEQGVSMHTSGNASIQRISNSEDIAKIVYHYAIELGDDNWWTSSHKTDRVGKLLGMARANDTYVTKRRMVQAFCQMYYMGTDTWYEVITGPRGSWSVNTATRVKNYYSNIDTSSITVPDGFELWFATPDDGAQSFMMWGYNPTGYVTMKKTSGNTSVTG